MERQTFFADVIVPQALPLPLTYRIPQALNDCVQRGIRVVVPLGKSKLITGIVRHVHQSAPSRYEAKYIDSVLDEQEIINDHQLLMWDWMAGYYCCTLGEVMNAALPAGLKLSSETKFVYTGEDEPSDLNEQEQTVIRVLKARGVMTLNDISEALEIKNVQPYLKALISRGLVRSEEELKEKFKPRTKEFLTLGFNANTEEKLQKLFAELEKRNAVKQSDALLTMLRLSEWDRGKQLEVERLTLQKNNVASATVAALIEKGIFHAEVREIGRLSSGLISTSPTHELSEAQRNAMLGIQEQWENKDICLLHGVTSSGKTEVYASLIEEQISRGKQVLFLLPEIALTTQIIHRLRKFFGKKVGVYHSGYSDNERTEVWNKVLTDTPGECDIILGARSAVFLPFRRLGLVIVDEEHEQSYKQYDPAPRYHARDTALWLARHFGAKVLLGSATPSVDTYWNANGGRYGLVQLMERFGGMELPEVKFCDLRIEKKKKSMRGSFSSVLVEAMQQAIDAGEQIILFQNRRGYSPLWECQSCGWVPMCTRCDVSLTYHKHINQLRCHYCGYNTPPVPACHACGSVDMKMLGFGTEKLEEELQEIFPDVRVQRMDLDTTRTKTGYQKIISEFEEGTTKILVGTQMVTKGLDFDNVSVVGIMNADKMMNYPDFRSMERSFQTMMQVAGRAGRKHKRGNVLIQTFNPDHWLLQLVKEGDYLSFYNKEIHERHQFSYPPFMRLMRITLKHKSDETVYRAAIEVASALQPMLGEKVLGPERPYIPRINNYFLQQFLVRLERNPQSASVKQEILLRIRERLLQQEYRQVKLSIDVDPV